MTTPINMILLLTALTATTGFAKPNILLILADDLGYRDLSVQGCTQFQTPHIDRLFNGGIRFTNGYVTDSVCAASRAGLLSGRFGNAIGVSGNIDHHMAKTPDSTVGLPVGQKTVADHLKSAGYKTICLGKWHLGFNDKFHPNNRGFDEFVGLLLGSRSYYRVKQDKLRRLQHNGKFIDESAEDFFVTDELTDRAIEYIKESHEQEQPFFLFLSYTAPHSPHEPKPDDEARLMNIQNEERRKYAGLIINMDDNIGRVEECLEQLGLLENTMIVFLSDNGGQTRYGGPSNWPLSGGKASLWEGGIRVPFGIYWKDTIPAGQVSDTPVISVDLLPTFAAVSGADQLGKIQTDGKNLLPLLTGKVTDLGDRTFYWRKNFEPNKALRSGKYKYYRDGKTGEEFLFNLNDDISEKKNLKGKLPEVLTQMRQRFARWEAGLPPTMPGFGAPAIVGKQEETIQK